MPAMAVNNQNREQTGDYRSRPRWSAGKKMEAVLWLLRGEPLETLSRELGWRRTGWRPGATTSWRAARRRSRASGRTGPRDDRALQQAERKVGQLTMENEILRAAAERRGLPDTAGEAAR